MSACTLQIWDDAENQQDKAGYQNV